MSAFPHSESVRLLHQTIRGLAGIIRILDMYFKDGLRGETTEGEDLSYLADRLADLADVNNGAEFVTPEPPRSYL